MKYKTVLTLGILVSCSFLGSCGENMNTAKDTDSEQETWFTEKELDAIHLPNLPTPINCTGTGTASTFWFNGGYTYSIPCQNQEILTKNAEIYFNYFKENYNNTFGIQKLFGTGDTTMYYSIVLKDTLSDYSSDNPCPLYKFYYVTDTEIAEDGFLKDDSVYSFEMRYDLDTETSEHMLKLYIEKASKSRNGIYTLKYKLAA